jgi:hypothetical protein
MQASRRGIGWAPYTWGSISRDRLAPHTSRSSRGIGRAPYTWGSRLGARVGSAAVGIHPRGRPDAVPAKGVAGERVPSQVAQNSHALREAPSTEMLAPRLLASLTAKLLTLSQQRDFVVPEAIGNNHSYCC